VRDDSFALGPDADRLTDLAAADLEGGRARGVDGGRADRIQLC